ncbi:hypothetical protein LAZ67_16000030 [Cordylochernes scorpioides]|uniref:PPC domain-containing protein n=1 Tax=Cordylochernes scorpioides TaxID=51811 RepID=A0ABY6LCW6_9ARAC|nr:hypothetical protein LAZ67_16000030 [Cordylochernes scorpioides]
MVWKKPEESAPKKAKFTISAGKVMAMENFKWEIFTHPPYSPELPQATSIFIQHSSGTLEASTLRMMTKCRRSHHIGGQINLIGGLSHLIGGQIHLIGGHSYLIGGQIHLIGGQSHLIGVEVILLVDRSDFTLNKGHFTGIGGQRC